MRSMTPWSLSLSLTAISSARPRSGWAISRPRNRTVTLSLSPSSRNRWAALIFVSMSWSSIFGAIRISFQMTAFCFFFASFVFCCSS